MTPDPEDLLSDGESPPIPETPPAEPEVEEENWKEKYFRALAEQENMRKRMQKEKQDMLRYSAESCISEFLSPIDSLENALKFTDQASSEVKNWATGFQMILSQFKEALHAQGVTPFHSVGQMFDPNFHEAVETEETEGSPEGTVLAEFTKGYKSAARVVRPARVKVAKRPASTNGSGEENINQ